MAPDCEWTRRRFCVVTGAALVGSACGGGSATPPPPDLAMPEDLSGPEADLSQPLCPGKLNAGPASALLVGHARLFSCARVYVLRDAIGIFAMTAVCTHMHCIVTFAGQGFQCPCHNSTYDFNGNVTNPPAPLPLQHFACALDASDNVIVDPATPVTASTRLTIQD